MTRFILLVVAVCAAACIDTTTTTDPRLGPLPPVTEAFGGCPLGSDCPDFLPCAKLDETACLNRFDCEPVYESSTSDPPPKFLACRDKIAPVCRAEGEACSPDISVDDTKTCCPGLYCCSGGVEAGNERCYAACPL